MRNTAFLILVLTAWSFDIQAQPRFEVDPTWPQSLPDGWILSLIHI